MVVRTRGKHKQVSTKELKFAAQFIFAHLVSEKIHIPTELTIRVMEKPPKVDNSHGLLYGRTKKITDLSYEIILNSTLNRKALLQTLAHELVHVKQYRKNQLRHGYMLGKDNYMYWYKKSFNTDGMNYFFTPWEVEAAGKENGLYVVYENYIQSNDIKF